MNKTGVRHSILIVDDESSMRLFLSSVLEGEGYQVTPAANGKEAVELIRRRRFDLIVSDVRMPELGGMELLKLVKEQSPETPVVILTAFGSIESAVEAMKLGAADYLTKPLQSPDEVRMVAARLLSVKLIQNQNAILQEESQKAFPCTSVVTRNPALQAALDLAAQVAPTETTVLLLGESGTGKELLARCIHAGSRRAEKVFVPVNCAALAPALLESELFGHEKGAFTGAVSQHVGRFERAHGGTLFLDEIGELDLGLQSKLLRVLETRQFERVGGTRIIDTDVRIVAATNRDLKEAIQQRKYREDLYYRLNVFPIHLPPLRERREDILPLADFLAAKSARKLGRTAKPLSPEAAGILQRYPWPGNVREMENVIERAMIVSSHEQILPQDLPFDLTLNEPLPTTLAEIEKQAILAALRANGGHHKKAADQLGISLRTLQYRLKEYGQPCQFPNL
jgi:two-component system, NtrC family, response regulator AtoC